jgi:small neutral amino acid transporter SnatA (MarC family)
LFPISLLMLFVTRKAYSKGEKWSWYALLVAGAVMWGSLLGYKVVTGYFDPTLSSTTFVIGAILFLLGISLPAKEILGRKSA